MSVPAVSISRLSTSLINIKPLECLLFLRYIRSRVHFEQMKGRGTRVLTPTDLQAVVGETFKVAIKEELNSWLFTTTGNINFCVCSTFWIEPNVEKN